jgi:hypothetical protein
MLSQMVPHENKETVSSSSEKQPVLTAAERIAESPHYFRETALHTVLKSPVFVEKRSGGLPGVIAFSEAAATLAQSPEDMDDFDRSVLSITSQLGLYVDAQQELKTLQEERRRLKQSGEGYPESLKIRIQELKRNYLIPFNRTVKELINNNPSLPMDALTKNIGVAYQGIYSHYNSLHPQQPPEEFSKVPLDSVLYDIEDCINGMRHEIAAESLLTAAGVEYDYNVSEAQDEKGRDIFVKLHGKWIGTDIKASINSEVNAHQTLYSSRAVWTGLKPQDFTGVKNNAPDSVSIPFTTAQEHADAFVERIERMASGELGRSHKSMQKVGGHAMRSTVHTS